MKTLGLALAVALAWTTAAAAAPKEFDDYQLRLNDDLTLDMSGFFGDDALTVPAVKALAAQAPSYDAFLRALQQRAPHLFENYVLLHATGSVQTASKTAPRVVLFGDGLFLAFAEDPATTARKVEILAFEPASAAFSLHEIAFDGNGPGVGTSNPPACAACHGAPAKPLWDPYDFWPNAFGAGIARMHSKEERQAYEAFFARADRPGIYGLLADHSFMDGPGVRRVESVEVFTQYVSMLNFLRVAGELKAVKAQIGPLKYAMYAALRRCDDRGDGASFREYFPQEAFASAPVGYDAMLTSTRDARTKFKDYLAATYALRFPGYTVQFPMDHARLGKEATVLAQLRFVLENAGISVESFPTSPGMNKYFASTPSNFGLDWLTAMVTFDRDGFAAMEASGSGMWVSIGCDTLKAKSLEALDDYRFPADGAQRAAKPKVPAVSHCIRCHSGASGTAPRIPFDDTMKLRELFRARPELAGEIKRRVHATDATKMPPYGGLTPAEADAVSAAVDALEP